MSVYPKGWSGESISDEEATHGKRKHEVRESREHCIGLPHDGSDLWNDEQKEQLYIHEWSLQMKVHISTHPIVWGVHITYGIMWSIRYLTVPIPSSFKERTRAFCTEVGCFLSGRAPRARSGNELITTSPRITISVRVIM